MHNFRILISVVFGHDTSNTVQLDSNDLRCTYQMVVAEGGAILDVLCKRSIYSNRTVI